MEAEGDVRLRTNAKRRPRPCSASYLAVRAALYQLTRLSDFRAEKIGGGFYADVFKVSSEAPCMDLEWLASVASQIGLCLPQM